MINTLCESNKKKDKIKYFIPHIRFEDCFFNNKRKNDSKINENYISNRL